MTFNTYSLQIMVLMIIFYCNSRILTNTQFTFIVESEKDFLTPFAILSFTNISSQASGVYSNV